MNNAPRSPKQNPFSPEFFLPSDFEIWRQWLHDLGGRYEPMRDLDERRPFTGRRDPDTKPRQYTVGEHVRGRNPKQYAIKPSGQVIRVD